MFKIFNNLDAVPDWLFNVEILDGGKINHFHFCATCIVWKYSGYYYVAPILETPEAPMTIDGNDLRVEGNGKGVRVYKSMWSAIVDYFTPGSIWKNSVD